MAHQFDDKKQNLKVLISALGAKEVDCRVKLTIHSVQQLPVLDGSFRVRWKFRDIDAKAAKQQKRDLDRKGHELEGANYGLTAALGVAASLASSSVANKVPDASSSALVAQQKAAADLSTDERGLTPYKPLNTRDHTVTFEHNVQVIAHMRIVKGELIGEPLKLVVERRPEESEVIGTNRKNEPRIGHKYIDLAEFVNEGKVRRKFLLEKSKTNAMVIVSLDIVASKTGGVEFTKPALRQDNLLIGRREPVRPSTREKTGTKISSANASHASGASLKPMLSRSSSTTSTTSSSAISRGYSLSSRGLHPTRSETEAVIEALFNPSIFTASPAPSPRVATPSATTSNATGMLDQILTPRVKSKDSIPVGGRKKSDSNAGDRPEQPLTATPEKRRSSTTTHSTTSSDPHHRRPTGPKSILEVALDISAQIDRDKTVRPHFAPFNSESWEFIEFSNGAQGIQRIPTHRATSSRTGTGDSLATDFSTTSARSYTSGGSSTTANPNNPTNKILTGRATVMSPIGSDRSVPGISIIADTPTTATPESSKRGKWYRFKKSSVDNTPISRPGLPGHVERRATAPPTPTTNEFNPGHSRNRSDGVEGGAGENLNVPSKKGILGVVSFEDPSDLEGLTSGQLTPTPTKIPA